MHLEVKHKQTVKHINTNRIEEIPQTHHDVTTEMNVQHNDSTNDETGNGNLVTESDEPTITMSETHDQCAAVGYRSG